MIVVISCAICSDNFLDNCRGKTLNFAVHFELMVPPQDKLKECEMAIHEVEFVIVNLFKLFVFELLENEQEYSVESEKKCQLEAVERIKLKQI